ncbi:hypothetical protein HNY73_009138 [Argiope bruennichi]|uniref:Uncharacterized protein n=1 Tax=Argiope bruennichi TaxID=94029 RepID=A0A8T0FBA8_ARGBR|nr:hypothetical protein HNY73_009138 [Argiope bruennichi]
MGESIESILLHSRVDSTSLDYIIVKDLLRFVLYECYPSVKWRPTGVFASESVNPPLSPAIKSAVKMYLEMNSDNIREDYELDFLSKENVTIQGYLNELLCLKLIFENKLFYDRSFLEFLSTCAEYSMLSYWRGIELAALLTLHVICIMMQEMRECGKIPQDAWKSFDEFCVAYVTNEIRTKKLKKPKRRWRRLFCTI